MAEDCDASVAVEFSLILVPLLGIVFAIVEVGLAFLFGLSLENTTAQLARMIQTGQVQQAGVASTDDLKSKVICPATGKGLLPTFVDCSRLVVDLRSANNYQSSSSSSFYNQPTEYCPGGAGQLLVLRVAYAMPLFLQPLAFGDGLFGASNSGLVSDYPNAPGWNHLLAGATVFQIETGSQSPNSGSSGQGSSGGSASAGSGGSAC